MTLSVAVPRINANDNKVRIVRWRVAESTRVTAGQEVVDLETSKAVVTIEAEADGWIKPLVKPKDFAKVGAPLYLLAETEGELAAAADGPAPAASSAGGSALGAPSPAAPLRRLPNRFAFTRFSKGALALLAEKGISPEDYSGAGLVTAALLRASVEAPPPPPQPPAAEPASAGRPVRPPGPEVDRVVDVGLGKLAEIQSLDIGESGNVNSMLSVWFSAEAIHNLLRSRNLFNGNIQPLILFELARLLKSWPQMTAYFQDDQISYYDRVDLGLAFDLGNGLKVVTIAGADRLMPTDFFTKSIDIGLRYMRNKLTLDELTGSTFTVTDLSAYNIAHFHPLINGHQSAILGIGGDKAMPGQPMSLNLTFDHRVTSGREVAEFLNALKSRILAFAEAPDALIQEGGAAGQ